MLRGVLRFVLRDARIEALQDLLLLGAQIHRRLNIHASEEITLRT